MTDFDIRVVTNRDAGQMTEISADVGWCQDETEILDIISRSGRFILGAYAGDRLLGTAAAYPYADSDVAFINEVIVRGECRNRGIATSLLNALLPEIRKVRGILRLYATGYGRPLYRKLGFVPYGTLVLGTLDRTHAKADDGISWMTADDLDEACDLDFANFGVRRRDLLEKLLLANPSHSWAMRSGDVLTGFILRGPDIWLLQCADRTDAGRLLLHATCHGDFPCRACLAKDYSIGLPVDRNGWIELTAMQYGTDAAPPSGCRGGCLPDIG
ncbi:MAG: GNAT family N-acetyltransferase [Victivallaceae bacterium]|nr:GNAT family N-acetyltransferase [Victivallaceae bacterium]